MSHFPPFLELFIRCYRVKSWSPECAPAGCMVVFAVGMSRRMLGVAGRALNVDDALCLNDGATHSTEWPGPRPGRDAASVRTPNVICWMSGSCYRCGSKAAPVLRIACMITTSLGATATAARSVGPSDHATREKITDDRQIQPALVSLDVGYVGQGPRDQPRQHLLPAGPEAMHKTRSAGCADTGTWPGRKTALNARRRTVTARFVPPCNFRQRRSGPFRRPEASSSTGEARRAC